MRHSSLSVKLKQLCDRIFFHMLDLTQLVIHNTPPFNANSLGGLFYCQSRVQTHDPKLLPNRKVIDIFGTEQGIGRFFSGYDSHGTSSLCC